MSLPNDEHYVDSSRARGYELGYLRDALEEHQRDIENLQTALTNSRLIGTACGIVMAMRRATHDEAFNILYSASQAANCRITVIARHVVETGAVPTPLDVVPSPHKDRTGR